MNTIEDWRFSEDRHKSAEWQKRIKRVNQFLLEYTEEGEGFSVSYNHLKHQYYSWCKSMGLDYDEYGFGEILHVLIERDLLGNGTYNTVSGIRMKHPVGLPPYYDKHKGIPKKTKEAVYAKLHSNGNVCALCGRPILANDKVHIDHIIPVRQGGTDGPSNLQVVHNICNLTKG